MTARYSRAGDIPLGSLVRLASGLEAMVVEQGDPLLTVTVFMARAEFNESIHVDDWLRVLATPMDFARAYAVSPAVRDAVHKEAS